MTTFYIVRHGQSEGNLYDKFIGHGNARLTELGKAQAIRTGEFLRGTEFDAAYASDLIRAYETGELVLRGRDIELVPNQNLREIHAGEWEGKTFSELAEKYGQYRVWSSDIGKAEPEGGESVKALFERVTGELARIAKAHPDQTVLIATHATPIRCIVTKASGLDYGDMAKIPWSGNSSLTVIGVENGEFRIIKPSSAEHLGDCATFLPKNV